MQLRHRQVRHSVDQALQACLGKTLQGPRPAERVFSEGRPQQLPVVLLPGHLLLPRLHRVVCLAVRARACPRARAAACSGTSTRRPPLALQHQDPVCLVQKLPSPPPHRQHQQLQPEAAFFRPHRPLQARNQTPPPLQQATLLVLRCLAVRSRRLRQHLRNRPLRRLLQARAQQAVSSAQSRPRQRHRQLSPPPQVLHQHPGICSAPFKHLLRLPVQQHPAAVVCFRNPQPPPHSLQALPRRPQPAQLAVSLVALHQPAQLSLQRLLRPLLLRLAAVYLVQRNLLQPRNPPALLRLPLLLPVGVCSELVHRLPLRQHPTQQPHQPPPPQHQLLAAMPVLQGLLREMVQEWHRRRLMRY